MTMPADLEPDHLLVKITEIAGVRGAALRVPEAKPIAVGTDLWDWRAIDSLLQGLDNQGADVREARVLFERGQIWIFALQSGRQLAVEADADVDRPTFERVRDLFAASS